MCDQSMTYGIKICETCCGYGLELRSSERIQIKNAIAAAHIPVTLRRHKNELKQCLKCKGTGWIFVPNHSHTALPSNTRKRW